MGTGWQAARAAVRVGEARGRRRIMAGSTRTTPRAGPVIIGKMMNAQRGRVQRWRPGSRAGIAAGERRQDGAQRGLLGKFCAWPRSHSEPVEKDTSARRTLLLTRHVLRSPTCFADGVAVKDLTCSQPFCGAGVPSIYGCLVSFRSLVLNSSLERYCTECLQAREIHALRFEKRNRQIS